MSRFSARIERLSSAAPFGAPRVGFPRSLALFLALFLALGCRPSERDADPGAPNEENAASRESRDGADAKPRPNPIPNLTPEGLLRETIYVYANAKRYSDSGAVELLCEPDSAGRARTYRTPCAVSFVKPNFARVRVGASLFRCDGKKARAEILAPAYRGQKLEYSAPLVISSIKEFYPDPKFAEAADLGVPSNLFWTSPQLVLLFAKDPTKTLVPEGARLKLLDPEYLTFDENDPFEEPIPCDRIEISAEDGARVFWISRETKGLVRCDLPVERTVAPESAARVSALRVTFPNQIISDSPNVEPRAFRLEPSDLDDVLVERFAPPDLLALKKPFPLSALREFDLATGTVGEPLSFENDDERPTLVYFWRAADRGSSAFNAFQAFNEASQYPFGSARLRFIAVDVDENPPTEADLKGSALLGLRTPIARLDRDALRRKSPDFPLVLAPSIMLLDAKGVVLKRVDDAFSFPRLQSLIVRALDGRDVGSDDLNVFYERSLRVAEFLEDADARDVYRAAPDLSDPIAPPPRLFPKTFGLRQVWRSSDVVSPTNPLAISSPSVPRPVPDRASAETPDDRFDLIASSGSEAALIAPCDGNALAIFSSDGRLLRKTSPAAAAGEPIGFVRFVEFGEGNRYFVASARGESRKIHRFDENFNDLGSLDVGGARDRRVGDATFLDVDSDGTPELILSLLTEPGLEGASGALVCATDMRTRKILWKCESALAPRGLAVLLDESGAEPRTRLFASDMSEELVGTLTELDPKTGAKLGEIRAKDGESLRDFATSDRVPLGLPRLVALAANSGTGATSLVGFDREGGEEWRVPVPSAPESPMERVFPFDFNDDGRDEWIVASPNGTILFLGADGKRLDVFQFGEELTGARCAQWNGERFLIATGVDGVSAWKFEAR